MIKVNNVMNRTRGYKKYIESIIPLPSTIYVEVAPTNIEIYLYKIC